MHTGFHDVAMSRGRLLIRSKMSDPASGRSDFTPLLSLSIDDAERLIVGLNNQLPNARAHEAQLAAAKVEELEKEIQTKQSALQSMKDQLNRMKNGANHA